MANRKYNDYHRINIEGLEEKQCIDCLEWYIMNNDNFGTDNRNKDRYNIRCKKCQKENGHKAYMADRDNRLAKAIQWKRDHPEKYWTEEYQKTKKAYDAKRSTKLTNKECARRAREAGKILEWQRDRPEKQKQYRIKREQHKAHVIYKKEWIACKDYFENTCAYCGLPIEEHLITRLGIKKLGDFHKEHVDNNGANDLSNCVPSCGVCNSSKHEDSLQKWYTIDNPVYSVERENKIFSWLNGDYKKYIQEHKQ